MLPTWRRWIQWPQRDRDFIAVTLGRRQHIIDEVGGVVEWPQAGLCSQLIDLFVIHRQREIVSLLFLRVYHRRID